MYLPKADILKALESLGYTIANPSQNVFNTLPVITFEVTDNNVELCLDNSICYQNISIKIDIWADGSEKASKILSEVEKVMRSLKYRLVFSADVTNIDKRVSHITTRFNI